MNYVYYGCMLTPNYQLYKSVFVKLNEMKQYECKACGKMKKKKDEAGL